MPTASLSEFIASEIQRIFAARAASVAGAAVPAAVPKRRGRPPGKTKAAASKPAAPKRRKSAKATGGAADRDLDTVLAYVKAHPGQRSEQIQKGIGGDGALIKEALAVLRAGGKVATKGYGRGGTYTAS